MGLIQESLQFQGQWRSYQKRVLDHALNYMQDHKIHIVAAPGSGKTTLGIELIRRLDAPCLILAPSITIRDQWLDRIRQGFLRTEKTAQAGQESIEDALLSNNIRKPALITAITYQALHSCIRREKSAAEGEDGQEKSETTDYSGFDFYRTIEECGIRTVCLDEAHHLRSEWWKALEEVVGKLTQATIISLTATPPYDSAPEQWQRYIGLCGPIDEEIGVPELVREKSLCAHQDYVYFNMPTEEERQEIAAFRSKAKECMERLMADDTFAAHVAGHRGLADPERFADSLLKNPDYLEAQLVFLHDKRLPFSPKLTRLLGKKGRLPAMDLGRMELLLQGFLYEDTDSYRCDREYRERLIAQLKAGSLIHKNQITLSGNETVNKLLLTSKGKLKSIVCITRAEYQSMGKDLRLLILTDYIKKEHLPAIGNPQKQVNELGVVPIFEMLRREEMKLMEKAADGSGICELQLAALSGSVVLLPKLAVEELKGRLAGRGLKGSFSVCGDTGYFLFTLSGSEETAASLVTELFQDGYIQVLVGTKSLLGEGWDSPCINSLILASFVGSFMLSNQMRGRAIRTMKGDPDKVSNIWHLVCMLPEETKQEDVSEDFKTMQRRFQGFSGVHYEEDIIENGMERLSRIRPPYNRENLEHINEEMLDMASQRDILRGRWDTALCRSTEPVLKEETSVPASRIQKNVFFYQSLAWVIAGVLLSVALTVLTLHTRTVPKGMVLALRLLPLVVILIGYGRRLIWLFTPGRQLEALGRGVLSALNQTEQVQTRKLHPIVRERGKDRYVIALSGGTEREKIVFADAVGEMLGPVDNPRYLLKAKGNKAGLSAYYCVPGIFGKRKEDALIFARSISSWLGNYEPVYTRCEAGRRVLLKAKMKTFANRPCYDTRRRKRM